jgi:hypothetical protein
MLSVAAGLAVWALARAALARIAAIVKPFILNGSFCRIFSRVNLLEDGLIASPSASSRDPLKECIEVEGMSGRAWKGKQATSNSQKNE